ncbi:unnamed protein product [Allacma fusca]|uniref:Origin recognition complex subunit 3 winged helix C-terminal domain-containing protein n=1 Tax=Allacma fusca TaxID=39272 RepID=A0A8J2KBE7_9HEXA|nr:unnamed protein product [Allacma fusca]
MLKLLYYSLSISLQRKRSNSSDEKYDTRSDVSIVYGLILEQQMKNVNLNIIFEGFRSQVEVSEFSSVSRPKKRNSTSNNKRKVEFFIRFRQTIAELQHLGFIRHSTSTVHSDEEM